MKYLQVLRRGGGTVIPELRGGDAQPGFHYGGEIGCRGEANFIGDFSDGQVLVQKKVFCFLHPDVQYVFVDITAQDGFYLSV